MSKTKSKMSRGEERPYVVGLITAIMTALFFMMLFSWIITIKDLSTTAITIFSYAVICVSTFSGSWIAARLAKMHGMKIGSILGAILFLLLFITGGIINGFTGSTTLIVKFILSLLFGILGGIVGVNSTNKRKIK